MRGYLMGTQSEGCVTSLDAISYWVLRRVGQRLRPKRVKDLYGKLLFSSVDAWRQ